jgi:hypothetical protein
VLGAAEPNAFGAQEAGGLAVPGDVGVGADFERADLVDEMYAGESQEQKRARAERYAAALTIVYARLTSLLKLWKDCAMRAKTTFMTEIKKTHAKRDDSAMKDISDSIDAA